MHGAWVLVRNGGWGALLALFLGVLGLLVALGALATLMASRRAAFYVGVASLVLASITAGVGLLGMSVGWHKVQQAVGEVESGVTQERILQEGYREAQDSAKVGFVAALLPLLVGAVVVLAGAGARRRTPQPPQAWRPLGPPVAPPPAGDGARWAVGGVAILFALLASGGAFAATTTDPPKGKYDFAADDVDAWALAEARETANTDPDDGCDQLDNVLMRFWQTSDREEWPRHFARDPGTLVPDWQATATTCARRIWEKVKTDGSWTRPVAGARWVETPPVAWDRAALLQSPLLVDDALHSEILAAPPPALRSFGRDGGGPDDLRDLLRGFGADDAGAPPPADKALSGGATTSGSLPPAVIQRIVRQHMGSIRACYTDGLRKNPNLAGKVKVTFVIGREGSVTSAKSTAYTLPDAAVRSCILKAFRAMSFPQPEGGGTVTVSYPIVLAST